MRSRPIDGFASNQDGSDAIGLCEWKAWHPPLLPHPDDWFIDYRKSGMTEEDATRYQAARRTCWDCPVRIPCMVAGLEPVTQERLVSYGLWGGYNRQQRGKMRKQIDEREAREAAEREAAKRDLEIDSQATDVA